MEQAGPAPSYSRGWSARRQVRRSTVDLTAFPGLVVMYLGMRVNSPRGVLTLLRFGREIQRSIEPAPDGLLAHERIIWSPRQLGFRQYWRDFDALEAFARSPPHADWWRDYLKDTKGTGLWHETYFMGGGMEAVYDNMRVPMGLTRFAPEEPPEGGMCSARRRAARAAARATPVGEDERPG